MGNLVISQGYQDFRGVAREREFTGKMITGIKNDIKRMLQSTFPEVEKLVNVFSDTMLHFLKRFPYYGGCYHIFKKKKMSGRGSLRTCEYRTDLLCFRI
jgi:hypothetical protein